MCPIFPLENSISKEPHARYVIIKYWTFSFYYHSSFFTLINSRHCDSIQEFRPFFFFSLFKLCANFDQTFPSIFPSSYFFPLFPLPPLFFSDHTHIPWFIAIFANSFEGREEIQSKRKNFSELLLQRSPFFCPRKKREGEKGENRGGKGKKREERGKKRE